MSGKAAASTDNTARRKWDREEFAAKAAERQAEEDAELEKARASLKPGYGAGAIVQREHLRQRDYQVDLTSRLGKTQVVTDSTPLSQQAGYYCNVCECIVKDSANFLDHINGKKHQRALGMSMRVERSSLEQVQQRFETNKRKKAGQAAGEDDLDARIARMAEEEEARKKEKRERKKQKKAEEQGKLGLEDEDIDPEMAAMMGFGGFGSTKQ